MRNALGRIQAVGLIGGSSEIGLATARALQDLGAERFVIAGRPSRNRSETAAQLRGQVYEVDLDLNDTKQLETATTKMFEQGDLDVVILAGGVLIPDPSLQDSLTMGEVNYLGTLGMLITCARKMKVQGHGQIVLLSSAGVTRPRPANYVYGSTKAGLDYAARGLTSEFSDQGVVITVVRPAFVFTKMTSGLRPSPLAVQPEQVAEAITKAVAEQTRGVIWIPRGVALLARALQLVPESVIRRLER